jgi:PPOX class probable F420-dependent enzyme
MPSFDRTEALERLTAARVAILGTVDPAGAPHLVPVTFAVDGDTVWTAVDEKPKGGTRPLRRHANILSEARVSLLVQHWDEDWTRLWWVRADGVAAISESPAVTDRVAGLLRRKYRQYDRVGLAGPVIGVTVHTVRGWTATPTT